MICKWNNTAHISTQQQKDRKKKKKKVNLVLVHQRQAYVCWGTFYTDNMFPPFFPSFNTNLPKLKQGQLGAHDNPQPNGYCYLL